MIEFHLISHVYNETYLLPAWIKHHREMFESAVVIDYASTDGTVETFKKLAPTRWNIINSRNHNFNAADCDKEVMDIESSLQGWKIALNTTEFLVFPQMHVVLQKLTAMSKSAVRISGYVMVDPQELRDVQLASDEPLWNKFHIGVPENELSFTYPPNEVSRPVGRLFHSKVNGGYLPGRHSWLDDDGELPRSTASILWYGFSPWTPSLVARKAQIRSRIPPSDLMAGRGTHHEDQYDAIDKVRQMYLASSTDLSLLNEFQKATVEFDSNIANPDLELELHLNGLPFGHKFWPADLGSYVNSHFGIESHSTEEAWQYLARLKQLDRAGRSAVLGLFKKILKTS
jgi:hypothetical protein